MTKYDIFNGDADGICALLQLRNHTPAESVLITGVKRDIKLLSKVHPERGDQLTVLDISLDKNRDELLRVLERGASVFYSDHHFAGEIPEHANLDTLIDTDANICTSLLINKHLNNAFAGWAVTGAYGDNLFDSADNLVQQIGMSSEAASSLKELGLLINYNGYGPSVGDLHFAPDELFKKLLPYADPMDCIRDKNSAFHPLQAGYAEDNEKVQRISPEYARTHVAVYILPDEAWARRISGVFSNDLVNQYPGRAHAVLTYNNDGGYLISVRAPLNNKTGADDLCRQFETGGGRKAAAGINHLPKSDLARFIEIFDQHYA